VKLTLFDLDGTLLPIDSDHAFGQFMVELGWADPQAHAQANDRFYRDYQAGCLDIHAYIDFATSAFRHRAIDEISQACAQFMRQIISPALTDAARELVEQHRQAGDRLVVVTATNDLITRPIAQAFGVTALLATELERTPDGRPTGRVQGQAALQEGKVRRVQDWLTAQGLARSDFETVTFYSDSTNDLPLLEWVTHPVATNPSAALADIARKRGWPVLRLFA
jgi:HAD superfamily hydrolase (TIGR01490 family)